jgi:hypothetical protein
MSYFIVLLLHLMPCKVNTISDYSFSSHFRNNSHTRYTFVLKVQAHRLFTYATEECFRSVDVSIAAGERENERLRASISPRLTPT